MNASISQATLDSISSLTEEGDYDEALKICDEALLKCNLSTSVRFQRAYLLFLVNRSNEAISDLDCLLDTDSEFPNAQWLKAGVLRKLHGDHSTEVLACYEKASLNASSNHYLKCEFADILRANGRVQEAISLYEALLKSSLLEDEYLAIEVRFSLGLAKMSVGDFLAARNEFQSVVDVDPNYPDALEMLKTLS